MFLSHRQPLIPTSGAAPAFDGREDAGGTRNQGGGTGSQGNGVVTISGLKPTS